MKNVLYQCPLYIVRLLVGVDEGSLESIWQGCGGHWLSWCSYPQWRHRRPLKTFPTIPHNSPLSRLSALIARYTRRSLKHGPLCPFIQSSLHSSEIGNNPQLLLRIILLPFKHISYRLSTQHHCASNLRVSFYSKSMCSSLCQILNVLCVAGLSINKLFSIWNSYLGEITPRSGSLAASMSHQLYH